MSIWTKWSRHERPAASYAGGAGHYRALCSWIRYQMKYAHCKHRFVSGPGALSDILCEGHTVASVIWEIYGEKK